MEDAATDFAVVSCRAAGGTDDADRRWRGADRRLLALCVALAELSVWRNVVRLLAGMSATDEKEAIRREMRRRRKAVSREARAEVSRKICEQLLAEDLGASVAVYLASPDEIDLTDFILGSLSRGVRVFAPRWTGETYELAELRGLSPSDLCPGPHGILEPRVPAPLGTDPSDVFIKMNKSVGTGLIPATWIVPGLAFSRDGRRIGYGGGWYDRLLKGARPDADVIGVAYSFQVLEDLPMETHDICIRRVCYADFD